MSEPVGELALPFLSGAQADTLDGYHAASFLLASGYTAADVLAKLLTQDGLGSGLDADTVSGYGIGTRTAAPSNNLDTLTTNGLFYSNAFTYGSTTGGLSPTFNGSASVVLVNFYNATNGFQEVTTQNYQKFYRIMNGGSWYGWYALWNSANDGNGGQPPAPKPANSTGGSVPSYAIGKLISIGTTANATYYVNGQTSAGDPAESWFSSIFLFDTNASLVHAQILTNGIFSGNQVMYTNTTNKYVVGWAWRIG